VVQLFLSKSQVQLPYIIDPKDSASKKKRETFQSNSHLHNTDLIFI